MHSMGNNVSKEPLGMSRRTSSIRSRISSKRWSAPHISYASTKVPTEHLHDSSINPDNILKVQFEDPVSQIDPNVSNAFTTANKSHTESDQNTHLDAEHLIGQLEAVLKDPKKYSTHHKNIARLAHRVSNALEGSCLVHQLQELIQEPHKFSKHEKELTMLTRRASTIFENPYQTYHRIAYSGLPLIISRVAQERNLFSTLVSNKDMTFSVAALVETTGIHKDVLEIFLEYMAAQHLIEDTGSFLYKANNVTLNLLQPLATHGIPVFNDFLFPIMSCLGDSLVDHSRRNAYQNASNTSIDLVSWIEVNSELHKKANELIQHQWNLLPSWLAIVDFQEEFARDSDEQSFVFVDVYGGTGNQCAALLEKYPDLKGRVILQDKLDQLQIAKVPDRVKKVPYDLFSDQHIRGAYVYYFRQVLHQYTDQAVVRILKAQAPAMRENSVLMIDEKVLPDIKLPETTSLLNVTELNILMVACFNSFERRQSLWLRLIDEAGYEVAQIHPYSDLQDCIMVTKLKSENIQKSNLMNQSSDVFNSQA